MTAADPLAGAKADLKPALQPKDFSVFVFGPALDPAAKVVEPMSPVKDHAQVVEHAGYPSANSFFRRGVLEIFDDHDGKIRFVDYGNHEACIERAIRYVRGKFSRLLGEVDEVMEIRRRHTGTVFENAFKSSAD